MKRVLLLAMATAVVLPFHARAQAKPDFSGTWTLDTAKSDPAPQGRGGGGGGAGSVTIETTRDFNGMSITTKEVRRLDNGGKEMVVETTAQTPNGEQKRKTVYTKS